MARCQAKRQAHCTHQTRRVGVSVGAGR